MSIEPVMDDATRAKVRRSAWLLAALAAGFYVGYYLLMLLRGAA